LHEYQQVWHQTEIRDFKPIFGKYFKKPLEPIKFQQRLSNCRSELDSRSVCFKVPREKGEELIIGGILQQ